MGCLDHRAVALRHHHPPLCAGRGRRRPHAACALPALQRAGRRGLGPAVYLGGLLFRQHRVHQGQLRAGDHRHRGGLADPGGVGGAAQMSSAYRSFAYRVDIDVPVERVWRAFTDLRLLGRWCAEGATIVTRAQGRLHVRFGADIELDAHIDILATSQRMRLILLPTADMPASGPPRNEAVIVEDFLFERSPPAAAKLRMLSSGVPSSQPWVTYYLNKRRYWEL